MAYVRYNGPSLKCIIDKFLFAKYPRADSKGETILRCLEDYWNKLNVSMENITAVATDRAPATMIGQYRGNVPFLLIIIIMVIFKCYFSRELITLS